MSQRKGDFAIKLIILYFIGIIILYWLDPRTENST